MTYYFLNNDTLGRLRNVGSLVRNEEKKNKENGEAFPQGTLWLCFKTLLKRKGGWDTRTDEGSSPTSRLRKVSLGEESTFKVPR